MLSSKTISLSDFFLTFSEKEMILQGRLENMTGVMHQDVSSHRTRPTCEGHKTISYLPNLVLANADVNFSESRRLI